MSKVPVLLGAVIITLNSAGAAQNYPIRDRGAHHRVFETVREVQTPGGARSQTNQIVELQGGLHRWTEQGWVETHPGIEVFQDAAIVRNLQYGLIVEPNLATPNAIDISLPDGGRVQGHLLGLALTEGNQSVLIAEVKDCAGVIGGPEQNELTFADAFTDFEISVKYVAGRDRLSQNVILHQQLPHPSEWGLTENAVLEVLTEFTEFPELRQEARPAVNGIAGKYLSFAAMEFVTGRAFSLGTEADSVVMAKTWELFENQRSFLVEKVPWGSIAPALAQLPPVAKNWRKKDGPLMARDQLRLPKRQQARAAIKPIRMASFQTGTVPEVIAGATRHEKPGYVLDWELVTSVNSNLWKGDTTYYIAGSISVKTNVFEGGCVIKFAPTNTAKLTITGPVTCLATNYRPIIMTARDDHSVGAAIGSAALSGYSANIALDLDYGSAGALFDLHNIRIIHAQKGISFSTGRGHVLRNIQFVNCQTAIDSSTATFSIFNAIGHRIQTGISGASSSTGVLQHVTFNQCSNLFTNITLYATNSLLVACTNVYPFTGGYNGTNSNPSAAFQTVGAGSNYLASGSSFRNAGTTNIEAGLLAALGQLTTYPPIVANHLTFLGNTNLTLSPQAGRDSDTPDLGWHYSPLDYAFGGVYVTNSTITVDPGTAIAIYSPTNAGSSHYGITLADNAKIFSDGTANNLNRIVRYNTVHEESQSAWNTTPYEHIISEEAEAATTPQARFRFTEWSIPAGDTYHVYGHEGTDLIAGFRDCLFHGGKLTSIRPLIAATNCLFNRVITFIESGDYEVDSRFQNCLFYGGSFSLHPIAGGSAAIYNSLFDRTTVSQAGTFTHDYNGFVTNATAQWLTNSGSHNVFTNTFTWQTGTLGRFYQPTNSPFLSVGSTNADLLGLYHYTVLTNNVKETNTMVDIGFHYVATDGSGNPLDGDSDGTPDYLEDINGNGNVNSGETNWKSAGEAGLRVLITRPKNGSILP